MHSRWFNAAVILFWVISMGWLLDRKILPPLVVGEPPTYRTILAEDDQSPTTVGWMLYLNNEPLGMAESQMAHLPNGLSEIRSRVRLSRLPLQEVTPGWVKSLLRAFEETRDLPEMMLSLNANSTLEIDPLGRPVSIYSIASLEESSGVAGPIGFSEPRGLAPRFDVIVRGTVQGNQLKIKVNSGEFTYDTNVYLPPNAIMTDALSPQARLPNLRVGQFWKAPIYSPLRQPTSPMEVLDARVERMEPIVWQTRVVPTYLVVLRSEKGSSLTNGQESRAKIWVDEDGNVLKQELSLLNSRLTFERLPPGSETMLGQPPVSWRDD